MTQPSPAVRVSLFGMTVDPIRMPTAVERIGNWIREPRKQCRFVVTPNIDHVVMLQKNVWLRRAYERAAMVLADGWPVVTASRLLGRPLPERVPGSDLVPQLFEAATVERPLNVYLLGALPGVAEKAADRIHARWPHVKVVGLYSPPLGFEKDDAENERILQRIADVKPDLLVLGLGAPKQEVWIDKYRDQLQAKVALCVGATIDFLAGERKRAPKWIQSVRLEWLHRLASEPKRLLTRYARDAYVFPQLVWKEWRQSHGSSKPTTANSSRRSPAV